MRRATEPVTVERTVYYSDDGTKFTSESACEDYELRKNGDRRECPECHGRGYWQGKFVKGYTAHDSTGSWEVEDHYEEHKCSKCHGKGYLDRVTEWR